MARRENTCVLADLPSAAPSPSGEWWIYTGCDEDDAGGHADDDDDDDDDDPDVDTGVDERVAMDPWI